MLIEQRKDLGGDVRPARQARIVIGLLMFVGIALDHFGGNLHLHAVGTLVLGLC
jgi:hypothetical protein